MKRIVVDVQMQGLGGVLFKWDDRELSASTPQKTYDTLRALRTELGSGVHLKFLLGGDQVQNLPKWFRFPEVLDLADWILGPRTVTGDPLNAGLQTLLASGVLLPTTDPLKFETRKARERGNRDGGGEFQVLDFKVASVSSTDVREALALGGDDPLQGKVLPEIEEYLLTQGVYATSQRLWKNS
jgi:nicotinic acid mononucleotide adenylyltransferase